MLPTTLDIIRSGLKADPTLTPEDRQRLIATLREPAAEKTVPAISSEFRLIRRIEVARRLSCCLRTVDKLAATGILTKHKLPGRVRASGFLASDVDNLILESSNKDNV
jgi:hypothetical protein